MNQPEYILTAGTKIRTNAVLESTTGIIVSARNIAMRKPNAVGEIRSVVGGHGGDVYWVQHDGDDFMAVYSFTEFELASGPTTDPVHPAQGIVNEIAAKVAPGHEPPTVVWTKPDDGRNGLPLGFFDDSPFVYEFTDANGPMRCHPASGVGPLTLHVKRPHVATLPDGRAVNLPAGTVLREGMTYTAEENFAALKRMAPSLAGVYERAAAKHGIRPWEATEEMAWEECPNLRPAPK